MLGSEGDGVMFFEKGEDVLAFLGATVVSGGSDEGPAQGVERELQGEFLVG